MKPDSAQLARARSALEETADELYDRAPCGYVSALPDGTIVRANQWICSTVQRSSATLVGNVRLQELLTIGGRVYWETHVAPLLWMQGFVREIALELNVEPPIPVLLNATLSRNDDGTPLGIRAILVDVTERHLYESELLLARKEAERAVQTNNELIAMISHDVRSPVSSILTVSELLRRSKLSASQSELVDRLGFTARNLLNLIQDVLDLGRLEAGHLILDRKQFDLHELLARQVEEHRIAAEIKPLRLEVEIDPDIPHRLIGDPVKLGRIVGNLLGNAIKFTDKGQVSLTAHRQPSDDPQVVLLLIEVSDTGIGLDALALGQLSENFVQGNQAGGYGGSGLGLGICQKLLALHGSELQVRSAPGQGAAFWFLVGLKRADEQPAPGP